MSAKVVYHVVRKNVEGAYLLDRRNDIIYTDTIEDAARDIFNSRVRNKQKGEVYVLFAEIKGCKLLDVLCER
jgi:hypothetical protein